MPAAIPSWERALSSTRLPRRGRQDMKAVTSPFPPADLLLKYDLLKNVRHFNNWMLSRSGIQWLNSRPGYPPLAQTYKVWKELLWTGFATGDPDAIRGKKKEKVEAWIKPLGLSFSEDGILLCGGNPVTAGPPVPRWRSQPLQLYPDRLPEGSGVTEVLWELTELNFRCCLYKVDSFYFQIGMNLEKAARRMDQLGRLWGDEPRSNHLSYIRPFPDSDFGLSHSDPEERAKFLRRLADLVCDWRRPLTPVLAQWKKYPSSVLMTELEVDVFLYVCQAYADAFDTLPTVPRRVPVVIATPLV